MISFFLILFFLAFIISVISFNPKGTRFYQDQYDNSKNEIQEISRRKR